VDILFRFISKISPFILLVILEWLKEATDNLLQTLKLQTAELFGAYDKSEDKIAFFHDQIRSQLQHAQSLSYERSFLDP